MNVLDDWDDLGRVGGIRLIFVICVFWVIWVILAIRVIYVIRVIMVIWIVWGILLISVILLDIWIIWGPEMFLWLQVIYPLQLYNCVRRGQYIIKVWDRKVKGNMHCWDKDAIYFVLQYFEAWGFIGFKSNTPANCLRQRSPGGSNAESQTNEINRHIVIHSLKCLDLIMASI